MDTGQIYAEKRDRAKGFRQCLYCCHVNTQTVVLALGRHVVSRGARVCVCVCVGGGGSKKRYRAVVHVPKYCVNGDGIHHYIHVDKVAAQLIK